MKSKSKTSVIIVAILLLASSLTGCEFKTTTPPPGWTYPKASTEVSTTTSGSKIKVEVIYLSEKNVSLNVGDTFILAPSIYPSNASDKTVVWTSDKNAVVSVDGGKVTAKAIGTAKITATASNGDIAICTVEVVEKIIVPYYISLNKNLVTLNVGEADTLVATIVPANSTNKSLTWKSSDIAVVSVKDGKITAVSAGNAEITAFTSNELMTTCMVIVENPKG
ncbi:MAG: Ig-like domain-containing protein [Eubacteriales bacterium]